MARDGRTAQEPLTRQPDSRLDGDRLLPPTSHSPRGPMSYSYTTDLAAIRAIVHRSAAKAGLTEARAIELVLAVSEVAANTVRHAKSPGSLKIWYDTNEIICQIHDEERSLIRWRAPVRRPFPERAATGSG
jgi:two-component sensor histidine kinase